MQLKDERPVVSSLAGLAHEDRLIIRACVPDTCARDDSELLRLLGRPIDWRYIIRVSIEHSVAPLLYRRLTFIRQLNPEAPIPSAVLHDLGELYRCSKARNERIFQASTELFERFAQQRVDALVLKDFSLVREVFAEPALRPMGDIDILIRRQQYSAARECLQNLDFDPLPGPDNALTLKYAWGHHFCRKRDNLWVDLQWNILQREWSSSRNEHQFNVDDMWAAAGPISIDGVSVLRPCPEHMLFHLCLHLEGHRYSELILLVEIAELLRTHREMDWDAFLAIVRQCNAGRSVHQVLAFAVKLLLAPVPATVLSQLLPSTSINPACLQPLFAPLSRLHMQLDEVRLAAAPEPGIVDRMEATVRRQASAAAHLSRELERLACAALATERSVFLVKCEPSGRLFADTALDPFGRITAFVLDSDMPRVIGALADLGYELGGEDDGCWRKVVQLMCPDTVSSASFELQYYVAVAPDAKIILSETPAPAISSRTAAIKLLRNRFAAHEQDIEPVPVRIRIAPLPAAELATYLIVELGRQGSERMFGISNVLDALGGWADALDWQRLSCCAQRYGLDEAFERGLNLLRGFVQGPFPCATEVDTPGERVLTSARYDHATTESSAVFKRAFFFTWIFFSTPGIKPKLRYAVQTAFGLHDKESILGSVFAELGRAARSLIRPRDPVPVLACWVNPCVFGRLISLQ